MNTITETMMIVIKTQREYLNELTDDKQKLLNENQQLTSELLLNSNKFKDMRKNHIRDLVRFMEINLKLEKRLNEVNKQNQWLINEKSKINKELINEKRKHAETTYYYEGRYYDGKCICVKDEYLCPHCRIEGGESNERMIKQEQKDTIDSNHIERIVNRIGDDDDDDDDGVIEEIYNKNNIDETITNDTTIDYINTIDIDNTVTYYDINDEKLPLIERIDRCLNNTIDKDEYDSNNNTIHSITNCYHESSITSRLLNKYEDAYNHKKTDDENDDDNDDEFNYFMANGKNGYVDDYLSNRL